MTEYYECRACGEMKSAEEMNKDTYSFCLACESRAEILYECSKDRYDEERKESNE